MNYKRISILFILFALLIAATSVAFASDDADINIDDSDIILNDIDEDLDDIDYEDEYDESDDDIDDSDYEEDYDESDDDDDDSEYEDDYDESDDDDDDSEYEDDYDDSDYEDDYEDDIDDSEYEDDYDDSDYEDDYEDDIDDSEYEDDYDESDETSKDDLNGTSDLKSIMERISESISNMEKGNISYVYPGAVFRPSSNSYNEVDYSNVTPKETETIEPPIVPSSENAAPTAHFYLDDIPAVLPNKEDNTNNNVPQDLPNEVSTNDIAPVVVSMQKEDNPLVQSISKSIDSSAVVDNTTQSESQNNSTNAGNKQANNNQPAENPKNKSSGFNYGILALLVIVIASALVAYKKFN